MSLPLWMVQPLSPPPSSPPGLGLHPFYPRASKEQWLCCGFRELAILFSKLYFTVFVYIPHSDHMVGLCLSSPPPPKKKLGLGFYPSHPWTYEKACGHAACVFHLRHYFSQRCLIRISNSNILKIRRKRQKCALKRNNCNILTQTTHLPLIGLNLNLSASCRWLIEWASWSG